MPETVIKLAQLAFLDILKKVDSDSYQYIRAYDDYTGLINVSGIEMPFHPDILGNRIVDLLNYSNIPEVAKQLLGENIKLWNIHTHFFGMKTILHQPPLLLNYGD
jgi:hypothetical protein